jgi:hypothetical protein
LLRVTTERLFVDHIPAQHEGLQQVLRESSADRLSRITTAR